MRVTPFLVLSSLLVGLIGLSSPVIAQQKSVKDCQAEWRANKAANEANGITEKAFVAQCRSGNAPAAANPSTAPSSAGAAPAAQQKTVKDCQAEWRANKAANEAN